MYPSHVTLREVGGLTILRTRDPMGHILVTFFGQYSLTLLCSMNLLKFFLQILQMYILITVSPKPADQKYLTMLCQPLSMIAHY